MRICLRPRTLATSAVAGPLAVALRQRGHEVVVAGQGGAGVGQVLASFVAAARDAAVVVPHSNAGRFGPAVAHLVGARLVCLDSLLPGREPDPGWLEFLRSREQPDGLLASWSSWWPREHIESVVGEH